MKIAVIDLGTNTFHLLIVESTDNRTFTELYRERQFIQLAENGIATIGDAPYSRALKTMTHFSEIIRQHQVTNLTALGTAALRTASNGPQLIQEIKEKTAIPIQVITGDEEARLICQGTRLAVPMTEQKVLIMDIGGGSVEFIIANNNQQFWAQSFPIGVSVLFNQFHKSDPISATEVSTILQHLKKCLEPLLQQIDQHQFQALVGASGTFDVLENILVKEKQTPDFSSIKTSAFKTVVDQWQHTTLQQRLDHADIPDTRAKLIVVAFLLIQFITDLTGIEDIWISRFAMKEGLIADHLKNEV